MVDGGSPMYSFLNSYPGFVKRDSSSLFFPPSNIYSLDSLHTGKPPFHTPSNPEQIRTLN